MCVRGFGRGPGAPPVARPAPVAFPLRWGTALSAAGWAAESMGIIDRIRACCRMVGGGWAFCGSAVARLMDLCW